MDLNDYIEIKNNVWFLKVKVVPNSSKTEIFNIMENGVVKIRSRWIPEKGAVNKELIKFISKSLNINKSKIEIISGKTDKNKLIKVDLLS